MVYITPDHLQFQHGQPIYTICITFIERKMGRKILQGHSSCCGKMFSGLNSCNDWITSGWNAYTKKGFLAAIRVQSDKKLTNFKMKKKKMICVALFIYVHVFTCASVPIIIQLYNFY